MALHHFHGMEHHPQSRAGSAQHAHHRDAHVPSHRRHRHSAEHRRDASLRTTEAQRATQTHADLFDQYRAKQSLLPDNAEGVSPQKPRPIAMRTTSRERMTDPPPRMSTVSSDESADSDVEAAEVLRSPPSPSVLGLWAHAARAEKKSSSLSLVIGVMFSRHGERFASSHMKIDKVGILQYFINHKRIAFVHILKFQALAHPDYRAGKWTIVAKQPIEPSDSERARACFMYNIKAKATKESRFFNARTGEPQGSMRVTQYWTGRLDQLIEEGAVISLEIGEAFDRFKIYVMLGFAVFVSLAVGLIYGFLVGNDFATGFSIASWLMTAFGFYATVASILISLPELR